MLMKTFCGTRLYLHHRKIWIICSITTSGLLASCCTWVYKMLFTRLRHQKVRDVQEKERNFQFLTNLNSENEPASEEARDLVVGICSSTLRSASSCATWSCTTGLRASSPDTRCSDSASRTAPIGCHQTSSLCGLPIGSQAMRRLYRIHNLHHIYQQQCATKELCTSAWDRKAKSRIEQRHSPHRKQKVWTFSGSSHRPLPIQLEWSLRGNTRLPREGGRSGGDYCIGQCAESALVSRYPRGSGCHVDAQRNSNIRQCWFLYRSVARDLSGGLCEVPLRNQFPQ